MGWKGGTTGAEQRWLAGGSALLLVRITHNDSTETRARHLNRAFPSVKEFKIFEIYYHANTPIFSFKRTDRINMRETIRLCGFIICLLFV